MCITHLKARIQFNRKDRISASIELLLQSRNQNENIGNM